MADKVLVNNNNEVILENGNGYAISSGLQYKQVEIYNSSSSWSSKSYTFNDIDSQPKLFILSSASTTSGSEPETIYIDFINYINYMKYGARGTAYTNVYTATYNASTKQLVVSNDTYSFMGRKTYRATIIY